MQISIRLLESPKCLWSTKWNGEAWRPSSIPTRAGNLINSKDQPIKRNLEESRRGIEKKRSQRKRCIRSRKGSVWFWWRNKWFGCCRGQVSRSSRAKRRRLRIIRKRPKSCRISGGKEKCYKARFWGSESCKACASIECTWRFEETSSE